MKIHTNGFFSSKIDLQMLVKNNLVFFFPNTYILFPATSCFDETEKKYELEYYYILF
jgi:hypothetical protein